MMEHAQLDVPCKQGRLIVTRAEVSVRPFRRTRRTPGWALQRSLVAGVSSRLAGVKYELTVYTHEGRSSSVTEMNPPDAFAAVRLLGYAWTLPPGHLGHTRSAPLRGETALRCKWGQLVITRDRVALRPRLWFRRHGWTLPRGTVSGVDYHGSGGARLVHDLVVYTRAGTAFPVYDLALVDALTAVRALGIVRGAYPAGHAPVHERPPETPPEPGGEGGVVIVPAPAHTPSRARVPSIPLWRPRRSESGPTSAAEPAEGEERTGRRLRRREPVWEPEPEHSGTGAHALGSSGKVSMLLALALLASCTLATVAGHGLPESWDALQANPVTVGGMPVGVTVTAQTTRDATVTPKPSATHPAKRQATPTSSAQWTAAAPYRPAPTATPRPKPTPAVTPSPTPTPSPSPMPTATPSPTPEPTTTPSPTVEPAGTATPVPTAPDGGSPTPNAAP
jgi:hypothetical protein